MNIQTFNHFKTINTTHTTNSLSNNTKFLASHLKILMDITTFLEVYTLSFTLVILATIFSILFVVKQNKSHKNLPPGPPELPIIGNLHQVGDKPHVTLANMAKRYGPLISLRLGKQLLVVASSPEAAKEILKTHDRQLSARSVPTAFQHAFILPHSLMWSECNQKWKNLRTLCRTEMFSATALESHSSIREESFVKLLDFLRKKQGQAINMEDVVFTTLFNTLTSIIFAKRFLDFQGENGTNDWLKESVHKLIEYGGRVKDFGSFFPILERFDLNGIRNGSLKEFKKIYAVLEGIMDERRAHVNSSTWSSKQAQSFLDRLLENGFSNDQMFEPIMVTFLYFYIFNYDINCCQNEIVFMTPHIHNSIAYMIGITRPVLTFDLILFEK